MFAKRSLSLLLLATLVGCGSANPAKPKTTKRAMTTANTPVSMPTGLPNLAIPGQAADGGAGAQFLQRFRETMNTVNSFNTDVLSRVVGHYKQGQKVSELRKVSVGYRIAWAKPAKFRAEVTTAPDALMEGAKLVTTDGKNLTARAKGLLSLVPLSLKANEPKLGNARNHTFDKYCPNAQFNRLAGQTAVWTAIGQSTTPDGAPMVFIQMDNVPRLDREMTREVLGVEVQSLAIRSLVGYAGDEKVTDYTFSQFVWNKKLSASTFQI